METISILLADGHEAYRDGLARAIAADPRLELVAEAADGRRALELVLELEPDVAVLDVRMPGLDGMEVLNAIKRDELSTRVVFLSAYVESDLVYRAIAMGAGAYLSKEADRAAIFDAVAAVARGEAFLSPEIQTGLTIPTVIQPLTYLAVLGLGVAAAVGAAIYPARRAALLDVTDALQYE